MVRFSLLTSLGLFLQSCNTKYKVWVGEENEQKIYNYSYGEHKRQRMDIFLPKDYPSQNPTVVMVHGGGWKYGRKGSMVHIQQFLHKNSIPTLNISYRLARKGLTYKNQLEDIQLAIDTFNELLAQKNLEKNRLIILGESAGAHPSLLYGYKNPDKIEKIISLSGPTDFYSDTFLNSFYSKYASPTISNMVGTKFDRKNLSNAFKIASPIYHVSNVPTLLFQGDRDFLVNKKQGLALDSVLTEKNIEHRLIIMEKSGHMPRMFNKKKRDTLIYPAILEWIKKQPTPTK